MAKSDFQRAYRFQETFFHRSADAHNLTGGFHLRGKSVVGISKFIKRETWHFCNHVVKCRLKGGGRVCNLNFIQRHTYTNLCRYTGDGITACFGSQCGRSRNSRIYLNEIILKRVRVKCKLHVAAAFNLERTDDFQCAVTKHMIFFVAKRLRWANYNGIACMDADGVEIFHITNGDGCVVRITHNFVFNFFITLDTLFNQNLAYRRERKSVFHKRQKFCLIVGKSAARTAERECRTKNNRIPYFLCNCQALFHRACNIGRKYGFT